jgi:hypothetical protein
MVKVTDLDTDQGSNSFLVVHTITLVAKSVEKQEPMMMLAQRLSIIEKYCKKVLANTDTADTQYSIPATSWP